MGLLRRLPARSEIFVFLVTHTKRKISYSMETDSEIIRKRKEIVEHPYGAIKRGMFANHVLMKGIPKVTSEFSLVSLAYNIKRVINIMGIKSLIEALS